MKFFAFLCALALAIATAGYCATFWRIDPRDSVPGIVFLHIGMFFVLIPAFVALSERNRGDQGSLRAVVGHAPAWLRWVTALLVANAFVSMIVFEVACEGGAPQRNSDGTFTLRNKSKTIRQITAGEYQRLSCYDYRAFGSFPMLAYSGALTVLVSEIRRRAVIQQPPRVAGQPAMPLWLHKTILLLFMFSGWLGFPFLMATQVVPRLWQPPSVWATLVVIGSAVFGAIVPAKLLRRYVPARCPKCGGRARSFSLLDIKYRCIDCGHL